jgi:hypothetical protein
MRPGWGIIERYLADASPEKQEEAYENLVSLSKLLVHIDERLATREAELRTMLQPPLF